VKPSLELNALDQKDLRESTRTKGAADNLECPLGTRIALFEAWSPRLAIKQKVVRLRSGPPVSAGHRRSAALVTPLASKSALLACPYWDGEAKGCGSPDRRHLKYHEYITCSAQAKIMIAKKIGMTIGGTSQAAMVLILRSLMVRLQRRHAYMEKARACRATIEKYALST
jgi:hypothetical protein